MAVTALFFLTVMYIFFDPVIEDEIYDFGIGQVGSGTQAADAIDNFLYAWQRWTILFIIGIFLLIFTAGRERDTLYNSRI